MFSRLSNTQTKLWVLTLGVVISILAFSPPCAPWKASTDTLLGSFLEDSKVIETHEKVKDRVLSIFNGLSD